MSYLEKNFSSWRAAKRPLLFKALHGLQVNQAEFAVASSCQRHPRKAPLLRLPSLNSSGTVTSRLYPACPPRASSQPQRCTPLLSTPFQAQLPSRTGDAAGLRQKGCGALERSGSRRSRCCRRRGVRSQPPPAADLGSSGAAIGSGAGSCRYSRARGRSDVIPAGGCWRGAAAEAGSG